MVPATHRVSTPVPYGFWRTKDFQVLLIEPHSHFHHLFTFVSDWPASRLLSTPYSRAR